MNEDWYNYLANTCGAVAVSYHEEDACFNAVAKLTGLGLKQTNIHAVLYEESFESCMALIDKVKRRFKT